MSALLSQLKKRQAQAGEDEEEDPDNEVCDDESSCGKSFSADELSEGDLKEV